MTSIDMGLNKKILLTFYWKSKGEVDNIFCIRMKIQFDFIADAMIFSLIRDMIRNIAKGGRSYGGKLQETVPSYD